MNIADIQQKIAPILRQYGVRRAMVFGSVARGENTPQSDIDLLVELGEPLGLIRYSRLARELEELLGASVDMATTASINPHLRPHIEKDLVSVYGTCKH
jgi:predicted nucleotidyltransferase